MANCNGDLTNAQQSGTSFYPKCLWIICIHMARGFKEEVGRIFVSKKRLGSLEKRVADLEKKVQDQPEEIVNRILQQMKRKMEEAIQMCRY